jgi:CRISPR-associated protein Csb1
MWEELAKNRKLKKPSELNHSSVPWEGGSEKEPHGGVTCDYIQQSTTISLPAIRRLGFPIENTERSLAAQTVLAAIALHAAALNVERGWHLRSRCDLTLEEGQTLEWEVISGPATEKFQISADDTRKLLLDSIAAAKNTGLAWRDDPIRLKPSKALAALVVKSQESHRTSAAED